MATTGSLDLPPPESWENLETLVADLARRELGDPLAVKHGRRGQGDDGVDVYARPGDGEYVGFQCKDTESLTESDIRSEVEDARGFEPPLDEYVIVWSGERDKEKQETVRKLSEANVDEGYFQVSLWPWEEVCERLAHHPDLLEMHFREERELHSELRNGGFVRLSESHFENQRDYDLEDAWRAGLRPVDVREGYAIDRWMDVSGEDDDDPTWVSMTGELLRRLDNENIMVRGPPGSGKSAVCLFVANQWYEQGKGVVLYRPSGSSSGFPDKEMLKRTIETAEGHVLVVVEDAVRDETRPIHQVMHDLGEDEAVSFLLDGRHGEDQEFEAAPALDTALGRQISYHDYVSYVDLGRLNVAECWQMIALYEAETDDEANFDSEHLQQRLDASGWVGDMLHATYHLLLSEEGVSGLEADARAKFDYLNDPEANEVTRTEVQRHNKRLMIRSAVLLNLLNLAGLPLHREFVNALPEAMDEDHPQDHLDSLVNGALRGWLVFGGRNDERLTGRHEFWSFHFLRYMVHGAKDDKEAPVSRDEIHRWIADSVNAVVAVLDDPDRRSRLVDSSEATDGADDSERTPENIASGVFGSIFGVVKDWPALAPLFEPVDDDAYAIRDADICPDWLVARTMAHRGSILRRSDALNREDREGMVERTFERAIEILGDVVTDREKRVEAIVQAEYGTFYFSRGKFGAATERFELCLKLFEEIGNQAGKAATLNSLGLAHQALGERATAEDHFKESLAITRDIDWRAGEAITLNGLGEATRGWGEWDAAEEYYEESLAIQREIGKRAREAATLDNLGQVYHDRGQWDAAEEYYEDALAIRREVGDWTGEATTLGNLGQICHDRGKWEAAEEYYEKCLAIKREFGDRAGEATALDNLGRVYHDRGQWDAAEEYYEDALAIEREVGDRLGEAITLNNLGEVAHSRGQRTVAMTYYEESLAITREIGDRAREATIFSNLGVVAQKRGNWTAAERYCEESLAIKREIGDQAGEAATLANLGMVQKGRDEWTAAEEYFEESLAIIREIGDRAGEATILNNLGGVARARGEWAAAEEYYEKSLVITREVGDLQGEAVSLANLGHVLSEYGDYEAAYEYLDDAVEMLFDIGAVRKGLTALSHLVNLCDALGESDEAVEHCERAFKVIEDAEQPRLDDEKQHFQEQYAKLSNGDVEQSVWELYTLALGRVRSETPTRAKELFEATWEYRDKIEEKSDVYPVILEAGVAFAWFIQKLSEMTETQPEIHVDTVLQKIEPDRDRLPLPAKAVFEHLHDGETETTPEGLRQLAQLSAPAGDDEDDEPPIGTLNAEVFATLLDTLQADDR